MKFDFLSNYYSLKKSNDKKIRTLKEEHYNYAQHINNNQAMFKTKYIRNLESMDIINHVFEILMLQRTLGSAMKFILHLLIGNIVMPLTRSNERETILVNII